MTNAYFNLLDCIENCIDLINENGGFTVVGWYKRGVINDRAMVSNNGNGGAANNQFGANNNEEAQVDAADISYHIVEVQPTNQDFFDTDSPLGRLLDGRKFDITTGVV